MSRAGYVLVGGQSSRMGRDKALLPFGGGPLAVAVASRVKQAAGSAVLVGSPEKYRGLGYEIVPDLYPGEGPLGGILTAMRHSGADWNLVLACDMPEVTVEFLTGLFDAAEDCGGDALVPAGPSGRLEPLCAVYHSRVRQPFEAAFDRGVRRVAAALDEVRTVVHKVTEGSPFQNVNTPEDWADYAGKRSA